MAIRQITTQQQIAETILERIERLEREIVRRLCFIGETARNTEIVKHSYTNRTGNLEASTGYVVFADGSPVQAGGFETSGGVSAEGAHYGKEFALSLASEFPNGFALVLVAGMDYAGYLADRGHDVLDSAEVVAERLARDLADKINSK